MTQVIMGEDCGNSPKNIFIQELTVAFAKGDARFVLSKISEDIRWNIVGEKLIERKTNVAEIFKSLEKTTKLSIDHMPLMAKQGR
jgi:hypothetical protein